MKKITRRMIAVLLLAVTLLCLTACGKTYTCAECGKTTSKAYYDTLTTGRYLCETCAWEYYSPFPIENFRVK